MEWRKSTLGAAAVLAAAATAAADEPRWQLGAGIGVASFPAYRGSDRRQTFVLPVPYLTYHGEVLKADQQGLRVTLLGNERLSLGISLAIAPPSRNEAADRREGMPDLKPIAEIGPQIVWEAWTNADRRQILRLRLPVRQALTVERTPRAIGWLVTPNAQLSVVDPPGWPGWRLGLSAGPVFGSARQHAYFYGVPSQYATPTRRAYTAVGGYGGSTVLMTLTRRFDRLWVGAFVRYDALRGAVFEDSPLVASRSYLAGGISIAWIFARSDRRVAVDE